MRAARHEASRGKTGPGAEGPITCRVSDSDATVSALSLLAVTPQRRARPVCSSFMAYIDGPPLDGNETDTLLGALERSRATLAWKCGGLDEAGMRATVGTSSMTLGGLLKHLAGVEDEYFTRRLLGRDLPPPWDTVDWTTIPTGSGTRPRRTHPSSS